MTIEECERRKKIYEDMLMVLMGHHADITDIRLQSKEELECIKTALARSITIESLNINDLNNRRTV